MNRELVALRANTWKLTTLPTAQKIIGNKWVYKIKYKPNDTIERFKA